MKRKRLGWLGLGMMLAAMIACGRGGETGASEPSEERLVMTSFYPLTYFAERIGGGDVEVRCPVPADADPAGWRPDRDDIAAMQSAAVVFVNGASFEEWVATAPLPRSRMVDTTASRHDQLLRYESAVTHSHGPEGTHSHEGIDGHTWLDPVLAIAQAEAVRDGLSGAFGDHAAVFTQRCGELVVGLRRLDTALRELAPHMEDVTVICSHPAYNYIGRRYGWALVNSDIPPDEPAEPSALDALAEQAGSMRARRIVLWESEPNEANAAAMRDLLGAKNVVFSPCESPSDEGDYLERMWTNIERLRASVGRD